jgi:hypothetical protein
LFDHGSVDAARPSSMDSCDPSRIAWPGVERALYGLVLVTKDARPIPLMDKNMLLPSRSEPLQEAQEIVRFIEERSFAPWDEERLQWRHWLAAAARERATEHLLTERLLRTAEAWASFVPRAELCLARGVGSGTMDHEVAKLDLIFDDFRELHRRFWGTSVGRGYRLGRPDVWADLLPR